MAFEAVSAEDSGPGRVHFWWTRPTSRNRSHSLTPG